VARAFNAALAALPRAGRVSFFEHFVALRLRSMATGHSRQDTIGMLEFLLPSRSKKCVMFSGTVNICLPTEELASLLAADRIAIRRIPEDRDTEALIDAAMGTITCNVATESEGDMRFTPADAGVAFVKHSDDWKEIEDAVVRVDAAKYQALMDAAGVLRTESAREYAASISNKTGMDVVFMDEGVPCVQLAGGRVVRGVKVSSHSLIPRVRSPFSPRNPWPRTGRRSSSTISAAPWESISSYRRRPGAWSS
jgi:hypothetical protein